MVFVRFILIYFLSKIKRRGLLYMKWEYKMFTMDHFLSSDNNLTVEEQLNKYGEEGWELIGILEKQSTYTTLEKLNTDSIIFKRQL